MPVCRARVEVSELPLAMTAIAFCQQGFCRFVLAETSKRLCGLEASRHLGTARRQVPRNRNMKARAILGSVGSIVKKYQNISSPSCPSEDE